MVHGALVLAREAGGGDHTFLPTAGRFKFIERALGLAVEDGVQQLVQIGVMVVKRPARDLALVHELGHGDLVKRLLGQQSQECILDGGFGQMSKRDPTFLVVRRGHCAAGCVSCAGRYSMCA